jgi:hypothetical protein
VAVVSGIIVDALLLHPLMFDLLFVPAALPEPMWPAAPGPIPVVLPLVPGNVALGDRVLPVEAPPAAPPAPLPPPTPAANALALATKRPTATMIVVSFMTLSPCF